MNNCKVSIIVPIYNVEPYVEACLQSVANQTMTDGLECIIVDDCGTDQSMQIVEQFVKDYDGPIAFKILRHDHNRGLSAARNTGIRAAQGEYIYFLDSDDEMVSPCLEMLYSKIEQYGTVDLVQGFLYEQRHERLTACPYMMPEYSKNRRQIKTFLLKYEADIIPAQSRLIRRSLIQSHNLFFKEGIIHEDNHWSFFLAKYVETMCFCRERTYFHRYNPKSITKNINIQKESNAYKAIVSDLCDNIDPFLAGVQKEYILNNIVTATNGGYYESVSARDEMINHLCKVNSVLERFLLRIYLKAKNTFVKNQLFRFLVRLYKL